MAGTTSNHDRLIVTKGSEHTAQDTAPDVCEEPDHRVTPYPNSVKSALLTNGTTSAFIADQPVWTMTGQLGPSSDPAHTATLGGVKSHTYRMEAKPTSSSTDVFFEGNEVILVRDTTTQNGGNTVGIVLPDALPLDLTGLDTECLAAASESGTPFVAPGAGT